MTTRRGFLKALGLGVLAAPLLSVGESPGILPESQGRIYLPSYAKKLLIDVESASGSTVSAGELFDLVNHERVAYEIEHSAIRPSQREPSQL